MNIKLLLDTGLTQSELASIYGVTRVTVSHWMTGRFGPHRDKIEHVKAVSAKLSAAIERGDLPLPKGIVRTKRLTSAKEAIGLTA